MLIALLLFPEQRSHTVTVRARGTHHHSAQTYPEINLKVSTSTKLPIANLEGDCHQIIFVQGLVEALSRVSLQLDGVCGRGRSPGQSGDQEGGGGESHVEGSVPQCLLKRMD